MFNAMANLKGHESSADLPWVSWLQGLFAAAAITCSTFPCPASSKPVPIWATFTPENSDIPANVTALALGRDGALWAGTPAGLARLDNDGRWLTYSKASTHGGLPDDRVEALAVGPDGALWVGTNGGLARLNKDGQWQTYTKASTHGGLSGDEVWALAPGPDGSLWAGTWGSGLAWLDKNGHWQTYNKASTNGDLPNDHLLALALGPDGALWAGTSGSGLTRLDKDGHWLTYSRAGTHGGLPDDSITALALAPNGALWAGSFTGGGLARLDKDGHWQTYSKASTDGGLRDDEVSALALGPDGTLWAGTIGGLVRLDKDGQWQTYSKANTDGGLLDDTVNALALGSGDALWVGTFGGGLARLDKGGHWLAFNKANTNGGIPDDGVSALALGPDGALWVGTSGGLGRLDKDGHWETYSKASTNGGLPDDAVWGLAPAPDGALWAGTFRGGLAYFKRPSSRTLRIIEVIGKVGEVTQAEQTVAVVAFDPSYLTQPGMFHYVWRMTERGLFGDRPGPEITTRSSVYRAAFDHDGAYRLRVAAVYRYGNRSEPRDIDFKVTLPKPKPFLDTLASAWRVIVAALAGLYALALFALLLLTRRYTWAFGVLSDAVWAKWLTWPFFFLRHVAAVQRWVLEPWFQAVRRNTRTDVQYLDPPVSMAGSSPSEGTALLRRLRASPRLWLLGRSGMGKSSVFAAWERAYFVTEDAPNLKAAARRYGFILITLPFRHYAALPVPDANRPESWMLEVVRRQLEQYGFATRDVGLIDAMLRAGHIALALDGTNEADRDLALAAFASQFPQVRLLVTSQAIPRGFAGDEQWQVWGLPAHIGDLRDGLLALWLGGEKGAILSRCIVAVGLSGAIVSGYDLRLVADLAGADPENAPLPADRVTLYRAMLARASGPDGQPLRLEGLEQLAWTMVTQRRRRIVPDDEKTLGVGTLKALEREGLRIIPASGDSQMW
jgi:hypothetical protein